MAVIAGLWVLRMFTVRAAIPFPQPDGSLLVSLALCGLACFMLLVWIGSIPLMPMVFTWFDNQLSQLLPADVVQRPTAAQLGQYSWRFLLVFGPHITVTLSFPIIITGALLVFPELNDNGPRAQKLFLYAFIGAITLAALALSLCYLFYSRSTDRFVKPGGKDLTGNRNFISLSLGLVCVYYPWINAMIYILLTIALQAQWLPSDAGAFYLLSIYLVMAIWQCIAISLILWRAFRFAYFLGAIVFAIPVVGFGSQMGGACLHFARMGGGIPISLAAKLPDTESRGQVFKRFDGCLVLRTGSETTIQLAVNENDKLTTCHLNPRTPSLVDGKIISTTTYTISNGDIIDIARVGSVP